VLKMNETLIYTDSRPRAKSTGHAFGFEGNLGIPVIISGMISVLVLTLLLNGENGMPLLAKFLLALSPTVLTTAYIVLLRSRRPPRFDLDLFASWINGRSFQPARLQPRHPFVPNRDR
jgi:Mn2+/Fe2+ NRAMP family transporter